MPEFWFGSAGVNFKEKFVLKTLKHTKYALTREEQNRLRREGHKYYQLMDGTIRPASEKQHHFVDMCNGLVEPRDDWERIWKSYTSTLAEERRLEAIFRENLHDSPEAQEYLEHRFLGSDRSASDVAAADVIGLPSDHSRQCPICRGSGMKGDGAACDRCNGRGWLT